jgi:hypothetical protein
MSMALARLGWTARQLSTELSAFGVWWVHELRDTWAAAVQRWAPRRSQQLVVDLGSQVANIRKVGAAPASIVEFPFVSGGELPSLANLWPDGVALQARAQVILPSSAILLCEIRLPPVRESAVRHAVELQLETRLPLSREQLYVDWKVREKLPDQSRIVEVAAVRRGLVERLRDGVRSWGWRVVAMTCKTAAGESDFDLLPTPVRRLSFAVGKRERYLGWSASGLAATLLLLTAAQWWVERARIGDSLEEARQRVATLRAQRAALATDSKPLVALYEAMRRPSAADALVALSAVLPPDTWIYQAEGRADTENIAVTLEAYTPVATSLLQALEQSGRFESIELAEAGSTSAENSTDRVQLVAKLRTGDAR